MAATADSILKSGEVSAMIRQGFISHSSSSPFSSPPPSSFSTSPSRPSPPTPPTTLFDMIARENLRHRLPPEGDHSQKRSRLQERIARILSGEKADWGTSDVELSVSSGDGFRVSMEVHRCVLAAGSRFFAENLGKRGGVVEICECDDAEIYVEVVAMMYCGDLRRPLSGVGAKQALGLLKVSAAVKFDAGVAACLEHLEALPWFEEEEEQIISVLSHSPLRDPASDVLQRVHPVSSSASSRPGTIFPRLLSGVLQSKDDRARRDMKALILGLLREDEEVPSESLYRLCRKCIGSLLLTLREESAAGHEIARESDNIQWLVHMLIERKAAGEFVALWAEQTELADLHGKIASIYRSEISMITAQICVALGSGEVLVSKEARSQVLSTWMDALCDDFGWLRRASRGFNKGAVEEGLCGMILTLPMAEQQAVLLRWFDRFLKKGDDCPNLQRAFAVWWRRLRGATIAAQDPSSFSSSFHALQLLACD